MHPPAPYCRFNHDFSVFFLVLLDCRTLPPKSCIVRIVEQQLENGSIAQTCILGYCPVSRHNQPKKKKKETLDQSQLHNLSLTPPCLTSPPKFPHSQLPVRPPQTIELNSPTHSPHLKRWLPASSPTNQPTNQNYKKNNLLYPPVVDLPGLTHFTHSSLSPRCLTQTHTHTHSLLPPPAPSENKQINK